MVVVRHLESQAQKENLDLPFAAFGLEGDEEEAPEVCHFYGQQFEGDGFFFCLDRSGSTAAGNTLEIEKREAIRAISAFSPRVEFAFVFFDQHVLKWPSSGRPARANFGQKAAVSAWLSSLTAGRGTCVREALLKSLKFSDRSTAKRNVVIYLGDGRTTCPGVHHNYREETLEQFAAANFKRHQINTICAGLERSEHELDFCRRLAKSNGGRMSEARVPR